MRTAVYIMLVIIVLLLLLAYSVLAIASRTDEQAEELYQEYLRYKERQRHE